MRIRSRPSICPSSQAANCSWAGCCSLPTTSIWSWMWVKSFRNSLSSIPHLLGLGMVPAGPAGQIVDGSAPQKKRPEGAAYASAPPLDVGVLDLGHLGGVVVVAGAAVHPPRPQGVGHADDRQHEQKEDESAADVKADAEQAEDDGERHGPAERT